jgi:DNA modification methylase
VNVPVSCLAASAGGPRAFDPVGGQVIVLRGDARQLPLPDQSVDLIVTSPPYWGLRSWTDGGARYPGQIGSEDTPQQWLDALMDCTREWKRVLKPSGSMFVNLGDKYDSGTSVPRANPGTVKDGAGQGWHQAGPRASAGRRKNLLGLPWRYALACTDQAGLILRAEIIWNRPNPLPEAVTDRVRYTHQQVFHFARQPVYYAAVDEIREPHTGGTHPRRADGRPSPKEAAAVAAGHRSGFLPRTVLHPLGKVPGSVWDIPAQPLSVPEAVAHGHCCGGRKRADCDKGLAHFAAFPPALAHRIIAGWSPTGICTACGQGRRPVTTAVFDRQGRSTNGPRSQARRHESPGRAVRAVRSTSITDYACACPVPDAPTRPAVVVDPFGGTGTTALVASVLGRTGITVDLSLDYCRLAAWRTRDPRERARVLALRGEQAPAGAAA